VAHPAAAARSPDVAVVGGGIVGLAAADALARQGADVRLLERFAPGSGQSAGVARGFRHLHATDEQIAAAVRARALWDAWSARAGEPLVGEEGALRLGGEVAADAARLRAAGLAAEVVERAGVRLPALRDDAGPLLWDPRGGAIRASRTIAWLVAELGDRVRPTEVVGARPRSLATTDGPLRCGEVVLCAGAGTERLWPHVTMRRVVHLRVTFAAPAGAPSTTASSAGAPSPTASSAGAPSTTASAAATPDAPSWHAATWADRSGRFGALTYGVADGPGRFALGLAETGTQPVPADPAADVVRPGADLDAVRARVHAYARDAFPGLGPPLDEVVRLLTILPGDDEDAFVLDRRPGMTVVAGHNLFKLAPLLGEKVANAITR
jgi:glycine/D-amino acid oxidase-like deaminating enzyme